VSGPTKIKLKVPATVAKLVHPDAPRDAKIDAARGALPLPVVDKLLALLFLIHGKDAELKTLARQTVAKLPTSDLQPVASAPETHPRLLELIARFHVGSVEVVRALLENSALEDGVLLFLAQHAEGKVLALFSDKVDLLIDNPQLVEVLEQNPHADSELQALLKDGKSAGDGEEDEEEFGDIEEVEEEHLSKYQQALELGVSEKIKIALTGDKEWSNILIKDSNKLVSSAVLKNPRITEGEVSMVAKNRSSSDDLIRLINLNREWVKNSEIRKALVLHPKTPLPKALRYMNSLNEKDLKNLAKSKNVSQVVVNNARRMIMAKEKKK